jgi:hypothetical protein
LLDWLEDKGTPLFRHEGPTNGETVLWSVEADDVAAAAARGIGGPPPSLDAGTAGEPTPGAGDDGGTP